MKFPRYLTGMEWIILVKDCDATYNNNNNNNNNNNDDDDDDDDVTVLGLNEL